MSHLPIYNSNDLLVRKAVAGNSLGKTAASLAVKARRGSDTVGKQKLLEMGIAQFKCLLDYKILAVQASGIFKPLGNTGADASLTLLIDGVTISDAFLFTSDNNTTATNIVAAIDSYTSTPEYAATLVGNEVHIKAATGGAASNGFVIALSSIPAGITSTSINLSGGQDGSEESDNILSEDQLEVLFNNIADITGCSYAPLGTKYR